MAHNTELGKAGETAACGFLTSQGYTILERNYRAGHNEIDIIAEKLPYIVFVEVKTRENRISSRYGRPAAAVTAKKRICLADAAQSYIKENPSKDRIYRFDVIEVLVCTEKNTGHGYYSFNHMKSVFGAGGKI